MSNRLAQLSAAGKITFLLGRVAPGTALVPMPRLDHQFRVLAIGDGLPSRAQHFLEHRISQQPFGILLVRLFGVSTAQPIDSAAKRPHWTERIHSVGWRGIHHDILRAGEAQQHQERANTKAD